MMRLQTYVKNNGGYTKSEVMSLQNDNKILVNDKKHNLSYNLKDCDVVTVDNIILEKQEFSYYIYNKPVGVICTNDKNVSNNIISKLDIDKRIYPVGRLDKDTHGLLILTNDNKLTHYILESKKINKEYIVVINNKISQGFLDKMQEPIAINGKLTTPATVKKIDDYAISITLNEGRYHQIRKLVISSGEKLIDLKRVRIGNISLDDFQLNDGELLEVPNLKSLL